MTPPKMLRLPEVRMRYAGPDDDRALARLAGLDSARVPAPPVLIAEVGGEPWAARSLATGQVIATPFEYTAALVELLAVRAGQLDAAAAALEERRAGGLPRLARARPS